ncbi:MAG: hypothetical protein R3E39_06970 [Anaerolineae bacterium]
MKENSLGDIVFERQFEFADANGKCGIIHLRIGIPRIDSETNSEVKWRCPYQLVGIGSNEVRTARRMDAIDAIQMSLQMAQVWLKSYSELTITWLGERHLGLSIPELSPNSNLDMSNPDSPFKKVFDEFFSKFDKGNI